MRFGTEAQKIYSNMREHFKSILTHLDIESSERIKKAFYDFDRAYNQAVDDRREGEPPEVKNEIVSHFILTIEKGYSNIKQGKALFKPIVAKADELRLTYLTELGMPSYEAVLDVFSTLKARKLTVVDLANVIDYYRDKMLGTAEDLEEIYKKVDEFIFPSGKNLDMIMKDPSASGVLMQSILFENYLSTQRSPSITPQLRTQLQRLKAENLVEKNKIKDERFYATVVTKASAPVSRRFSVYPKRVWDPDDS
ncbi:MAG: hypothetical protein ACHQJ6_05650 [Candidatus Berkiellales bacterium]